MLHVNSRETTFEHQRVPAARFNNIFLKLFDRHATYCYLQVDLKSFLASGAFFLGREATERATISQVINSSHSSVNGFLGLACNSQSLPPSLDKNTIIAISYAILNSQDCFCGKLRYDLKTLNPFRVSSLPNAERDTTNFAVNEETLGTSVPRHQGTCIIPSKSAGL